MGLWDKIKGEFVDIIEWLDDSRETMVFRFERYGNEIKYGAKLIVREGQVGVFINEGALADVFQPGTHTLKTENLPILSTLKGWKYGFESPFKAEVYFVSTRQFTDRKWGTKNPIMLRDPEFGPVRIRAFGTYALKVSDAATFLREIVGTDSHFEIDDVTNQLRNMMITRFIDIVGESKIPILDMASNYNEFGDFVTDKLKPEFLEYGLTLTKVLIENISLPPAVEEALDKRSSMGIIGDLSKYTQYQAAEAMEQAAKNPGGGASEGMGMGMGFAMAQQMANAMSPPPQQQAPQQQAPAMPPPLPQAVQYHVAINGQSGGPFGLDVLKQQAQAGTFTRDSMVWKEGMAQWAKAGEVAALNSVFGAVPPPLPPM